MSNRAYSVAGSNVVVSLILGWEGRQAGYLRLCQSDGVDYILLSDVMSCAVPWLGGRSEAVSGSQ